MKKLFFIALMLSAIITSRGQGFNYQAVARDESDAVLSNRELDVEISIYSDEFTSNPLYSETHDLTTNAYGMFSLVIGAGIIKEGDFDEIDWSNPGYFLGVKIDAGNSISDMGRAGLQAVPYSRYANSAGKATDMKLKELSDVTTSTLADGEVLKWDVSTQSWQPSNDNVSSGNGASVNTSARLTGDGSTDTPLDIASQGAQEGQVLTWQNNNWQPATSANNGFWLQNGDTIYYNDGPVGIGTSSPTAMLNIRGHSSYSRAQLSLTETTITSPARIFMGNETPDKRLWRIEAVSDQESPEFKILNSVGNASFVRLSIYNNVINLGLFDDNVGIAWGSPKERLHVNGAICMGNTTKTNPGTIRWTGTDFEGYKVNQWVSLTGSGGGGSSVWELNGTNAFYNSGNVGIGLNTPQNKMHLHNNDALFGSPTNVQLTNAVTGTTASDGLLLTLNSTLADYGLIGGLRMMENRPLGFATNGAYHLFLKETGLLGLGTFNPKGKMDILYNSSTTSPQLMISENEAGFGRISFNSVGVNNKYWTVAARTQASDPSSQFNFYYFNGTSGQDILSINGNGNVGIGTQAPSRMLQLHFNNANGISSQFLISQAGTGDAFMNFGLTGSSHYAVGIDNSDSDKLKIGFNATEAGGVGQGTVLSLDQGGNMDIKGEVTRPSTGGANLVPICYGYVLANGTVNTGTGNFSVSRTSAGKYSITITGEDFFFSNYIVLVTPTTGLLVATAGSNEGKLTIELSAPPLGEEFDANFNFIVYKP